MEAAQASQRCCNKATYIINTGVDQVPSITDGEGSID